jgi:hypothetical protein
MISGEEFKIIIQKIYPYKHVIVITQNEPETDLGTIAKWKTGKQSSDDYYNENLLPSLVASSEEICRFRLIEEKYLSINNNIDTVLKEKVKNTLDGINPYDSLSVEDINNVISLFKEIEGLYGKK